MRWYIDNNRLVTEYDGNIMYLKADEIFALNSGEKIKNLPDMEKIPIEELGIRFSKLGARIRAEVKFETDKNEIQFELYAVRGGKHARLFYKDGDLPDSVIIDNTWYSLLANHDDTVKLLEAADITESGCLSLQSYIALIKHAKHYMNVDLIDEAEDALANHPVKDRSDEMPVALRATLYPYQQQGYQWMRFVAEEHCGCILGDEMGLGKTLQVITLIADRHQNGKGISLIIAPVSLLENWRREFNKFTEGIKVFVHHGSKRTGLYTDLLDYDVVIISYNTAGSDQSLLKMIDWDLVVVDEAQNIKNPSANRTKSIKNVPRHVAIAVTGTPFENHISDLWSLMDFVAPGCFGKLSEFEMDYPDDLEGAQALEPILSPIMIRRRVADVAKDLPERIDVAQVIQMSSEEVNAYEEVREKILENFDGENATLPMIQKLRMFCTHPMLIDDSLKKNPVLSSGKYERLCEILEEISLLNEKVILFTSYNRMFEILQQDIPERFGMRVLAINGSTPPEERQPIIDQFSDIAGTALLVLNPRAAGAGLNITSASRVIHYNLEWNPSLEDQASARAYRRGQTKTVFIYRLYYKDTVEEIINERIDKKRDMFSAAVVGTDGTTENSEDIIRALMISPGGGQNGK
jgi:SNF2 family DNA or RNA helicase